MHAHTEREATKIQNTLVEAWFWTLFILLHCTYLSKLLKEIVGSYNSNKENWCDVSTTTIIQLEGDSNTSDQYCGSIISLNHY